MSAAAVSKQSPWARSKRPITPVFQAGFLHIHRHSAEQDFWRTQMIGVPVGTAADDAAAACLGSTNSNQPIWNPDDFVLHKSQSWFANCNVVLDRTEGGIVSTCGIQSVLDRWELLISWCFLGTPWHCWCWLRWSWRGRESPGWAFYSFPACSSSRQCSWLGPTCARRKKGKSELKQLFISLSPVEASFGPTMAHSSPHRAATVAARVYVCVCRADPAAAWYFCIGRPVTSRVPPPPAVTISGL